MLYWSYDEKRKGEREKLASYILIQNIKILRKKNNTRIYTVKSIIENIQWCG